jgi:hypothetical protein
MNKIIAFVGGLGKYWKPVSRFLNGSKTYMLGTVTVAQGIAGLWDSLAAISPEDPATVVAFVRSLSDNPDWKMVLAGIAMFTIRHAIQKAGPVKIEAPLGEAPK